jgi:predicted PurR-regulated permease PerM
MSDSLVVASDPAPLPPATGAASLSSLADHPVDVAKVPRSRSDLRTLKRTALTILVLLCGGICYLAQELLIPVILAMLISLLLSPVVTLLERWRLPRAIGSLLVLAIVVAGFTTSVVRLAQPARDWVSNAPATIQTLQMRFQSFREPIRQAQEASKKIEDLTQSSPAERTVITAQPGLLASMATSTPRALGAIAAVLVLVYFFLSSGNGFLRRVVEIAPRLTEKKKVVLIARDMQEEMSRYLLTVSLINLALGCATAIGAKLFGLPNPLLWGAVAAILNFAPYVGPATTGFALFIAGFTTFDSFGHALALPGSFFLLAFIEGQLITPMIIGRRLSLDPTVVFVWLLLWGWLWGIVGILLAGPLLACFRIVCQHVESLQPISVLIGDGSHEPRRTTNSAG